MKKSFTILSALTLAFTLKAQPQIHGNVLLQNSRIKTGSLQPVAGAGISADSGGSVISDQDGRYSLAFAGIRDMTHARIQAHKHGLVLVNERDLQAATIGAQAPLRIFMADSAVLAQEQALLYEINLKVLTAEKDKLIQRLRSDYATSQAMLAELKERFNQEFEHRWAAEDFLNDQLEEVKERLPERVVELARVNLDFASERYRRAYAFFREGKMDLALRLLDSLDVDSKRAEEQLKSLDDNAQGYNEAKEAIDLSARQVVDCYRLKSEAFSLRFEYRKAAGVLEKGLALLLRLKRGGEDLEVAEAYRDLGKLNWSLGFFDIAIEKLRTSHEIKKNLLPEFDEDIAVSFNDLAMTYHSIGDRARAIFLLENAVRTILHYSDSINPTMLICFSNYAILLTEEGEYDLALDAQQTAIRCLEMAQEPPGYVLATFYSNLSAIYFGMKEYVLAMDAIKKAIAISEKEMETNDPLAGMYYSNLAALLVEMKEFPKALEAMQSSIVRHVKILDENHPSLATSYTILATIHFELNEHTIAFIMQRKAIEIQEKVLDANHPNLITSYSNLGSLFSMIDRLDSAIFYKQRSLDIMHLDPLSSYPHEVVIRMELASLFEELGNRKRETTDYYSAINAYQKGLNFAPNAALYNAIGLCHYFLNEYPQAIEAYDNAISLDSKLETAYLNNTGMAYTKLGDFKEAKKRILKMEQIKPDHYLPFRAWSLYYALEKDNERSITNLEKTIQLGYTDLNWIKSEEAFDALRDHPRYIALIKSLEEKFKEPK